MGEPTKISDVSLAGVVLDRLRKTAGCHEVLNVKIVPAKGLSNWDAELVSDGDKPMILPQSALGVVRSLQLSYVCRFMDAVPDAAKRPLQKD